jgi:hypothetical protein
LAIQYCFYYRLLTKSWPLTEFVIPNHFEMELQCYLGLYFVVGFHLVMCHIMGSYSLGLMKFSFAEAASMDF